VGSEASLITDDELCSRLAYAMHYLKLDGRPGAAAACEEAIERVRKHAQQQRAATGVRVVKTVKMPTKTGEYMYPCPDRVVLTEKQRLCIVEGEASDEVGRLREAALAIKARVDEAVRGLPPRGTIDSIHAVTIETDLLKPLLDALATTAPGGGE
jgi:hypothetical protein